MNELFIRLYLDEDVNVRLAEMLKNRGYYAITTSDMGFKGKTDREQIEYAIQNQLTILTHNRVDFEEINLDLYNKGEEHFGIIISPMRPIQELFSRLIVILNELSAEEMKNQVVYI
jgi:predicted nuclease of predicted toxin-antitoxin system